MTYSQLRQQTLDKLYLTLDEAQDMDYLEKIPRAFNEALNRIANSLNCYTKKIKFNVAKQILYDNINTGLILKMPPDFISFDQINNSYLDGQLFVVDNYESYNQLRLYGNEVPGYNIFESEGDTVTYEIYYNAFYPQILSDARFPKIRIIEFKTDINMFESDETTWKVKDLPADEYDFDNRIAYLLPYYAASICLGQDDRALSAQYRNEFEMYLAQVDVTNYQRPREYRSVKGLY